VTSRIFSFCLTLLVRFLLCTCFAFVLAGQSCIAPDYVFVPRKLKKAFTDECARVAKGFYGDAPSTTADYGRIVNDRHMSRLAKVIDASRGHILYGGDYDLAKKYIEPTLVDATTASPSMQEELFGPVLPVVEYDDIDSAIEYINSQPKPLALYIFSSNSSFQQRVLNTTSAGGVSINDVMMHFANANLPFGGVGNSGMGAYHGKHGYETFSHAKSVLNKSLSVNTKTQSVVQLAWWLHLAARVHRCVLTLVRHGHLPLCPSSYGDAPARYPPYTAFNAKLFRFVSELYKVNSSTFGKLFKFVVLPVGIALGVWASWKTGHISFQ